MKWYKICSILNDFIQNENEKVNAKYHEKKIKETNEKCVEIKKSISSR